jgi:hypothetical protein
VPVPIGDGIEHLFSILIPDEAVLSGSPPETSTEAVTWLPTPGEGRLYEVVILRVRFDFPGQVRHAPARLADAVAVGMIEVPPAAVLVRALNRERAPHENDTLEAAFSMLADRRRVVGRGPQRMVMWGTSATSGAWFFAELAVP